MAPFPALQHPHKRIKKLGAKLAEFAVKHPNLRLSLEEVSDAQMLLPYLTPYAVEVLAPLTTATIPELQLYIECKVLLNLTKLLEGLVYICIPQHLDDLCEKGLAVYCSALAAVTRIAEHARVQETSQGKALARKLLDQLQPEDNEQAPGMYAFQRGSVVTERQCETVTATVRQFRPHRALAKNTV